MPAPIVLIVDGEPWKLLATIARHCPCADPA
jgi:hypothetical protein